LTRVATRSGGQAFAHEPVQAIEPRFSVVKW
jgi:hypothetical protein